MSAVIMRMLRLKAPLHLMEIALAINLDLD
jgi:hypothetical protein